MFVIISKPYSHGFSYQERGSRKCKAVAVRKHHFFRLNVLI